MAGLEMKYFVLNPHEQDEYGRASRAALEMYAAEIAIENPQLAADIRLWVDQITSSINPNMSTCPVCSGTGNLVCACDGTCVVCDKPRYTEQCSACSGTGLMEEGDAKNVI